MLPLHRESEGRESKPEKESTLSFDFKNDGFVLDAPDDTSVEQPDELPTESAYASRRNQEMGSRDERNPFITDSNDEYENRKAVDKDQHDRISEAIIKTASHKDDIHDMNEERHKRLERDITNLDSSPVRKQAQRSQYAGRSGPDILTHISIALFIAVLSIPTSFAIYHYGNVLIAYLACVFMISLPSWYVLIRSMVDYLMHGKHMSLMIPMLFSLFSLVAIGFMAWYELPYLHTLSMGVSQIINAIL